MDYSKSILWEKSMCLADCILKLATLLPAEERYGMRSQITRAATSVPSNVAEGWARESRKEKVQFLAIAHGSLAELHTQMLLCERAGWLSRTEIGKALGLADEVGKMLTALKHRWGTSNKRLPARS